MILGPLSQLINDLLNCLSNPHPRMYADDTNLTYSGSDIDILIFNFILMKIWQTLMEG